MLKMRNQLRNAILRGIVVLLLSSLLSAIPTISYAQSPEPETPQEPEEIVVDVPQSTYLVEPMTQQEAVNFGDELTFSLFEYEEVALYSPFDESDYDFGLPAEWQFTGGARLELDLAVFFERPDVVEGFSGLEYLINIPGGLLRIIFNDVTLTSIVLESIGEKTYIISIPSGALEPTREDGRHELIVELIADEYCLYGFETTVVVRPTSRLVLPHNLGNATTDLALLPRPFFQDGAFWQNEAILVVPDDPSVEELKSALSVAAGFGRLTGGDLMLTLQSEGQLTADQFANNHLIFVGKTAAFSSISGLPTSVNEMVNTYPDDGLVYLGESPWNLSKGVLLVSGGSDQGIVKAGQAVSTGLVLGSIEPNIALIETINPAGQSATVSPQRTFFELGYPTNTIRGIGTINREYRFYVPPGQSASENAYVNLNFAHSALLHYERSGLVITLNGVPIGSARFSDETAQSAEVQAPIPKDLIRAGYNSLFVQIVLLPRDVCDTAVYSNFWVRVNGDSILQLPLLPIQDNLVGRILDLSLYPEVFALSPSEGSVAFIVPPADTNAWNVAVQVAENIGDQTNWSLSELEVAYANSVSDEILSLHDLLIFGKPSSLPLIAEMGDVLPAPFSAGSDLPSEQNLQVGYRVPEDVSAGFIELVQSPWSSDRAVLAVLGSSDQGVLWSGDALTVPELSGNLAGDFAIIQDKQIITSDSRLVSKAVGSLPDVSNVQLDREEISGAEIPTPRPSWVLPVLAGAIVLLVVIVIIAMFSSLRRSRT